MSGECSTPEASIYKGDKYNGRTGFNGKILIQNAEPFENLGGHEITGNEVYEIGGPMNVSESYDTTSNNSSHRMILFHGVVMLAAVSTTDDDKGQIHTSVLDRVFVSQKRPKWNGNQSAAVYVQRSCQTHRQLAVKQIAEILYVHTAKGRCTVSSPNVTQIAYPGRDSFFYNWQFYQNYKYCVTMENSYTPGYISEKIFNGFLAGCVPIYFGTHEIFDIFNDKAFIYMMPSNRNWLSNKICT